MTCRRTSASRQRSSDLAEPRGGSRSRSMPFEPGAVGEVLLDPHLGVERDVLGQVAEVPPHGDRVGLPPRGRARRASRAPRSGGRKPVSMRMVVVLPAPFGPEDADDLPLGEGEGDAGDGREIAELAGQVVRFDHAGHVSKSDASKTAHPARQLGAHGTAGSAQTTIDDHGCQRQGKRNEIGLRAGARTDGSPGNRPPQRDRPLRRHQAGDRRSPRARPSKIAELEILHRDQMAKLTDPTSAWSRKSSISASAKP